MYMNVFEYRLRDDVDHGAYQAHGERMYALVTSDPSFEFIDMKSYEVSKDEGVVLERFGSLEGARRWAANPVTAIQLRTEFSQLGCEFAVKLTRQVVQRQRGNQ